MIWEVAAAAAPVRIPLPPSALQMTGYAQAGVEVPFLDPVGQDAVDGLQAEQLEGMEPQRKQCVGLPAAGTKLAVDPQLEAGKTFGDVIALSPSVAVQPGAAEGARRKNPTIGKWEGLWPSITCQFLPIQWQSLRAFLQLGEGQLLVGKPSPFPF